MHINHSSSKAISPTANIVITGKETFHHVNQHNKSLSSRVVKTRKHIDDSESLERNKLLPYEIQSNKSHAVARTKTIHMQNITGSLELC